MQTKDLSFQEFKKYKSEADFVAFKTVTEKNRDFSVRNGKPDNFNESNEAGLLVEVMIDGLSEDGLIGRSQYEAPEVDGVVFLPEFDAVPGDRFDVQVNSALDYDLIAGWFFQTVENQ